MKPTIAIYGIRDRGDYDYPGHTHDHSICVMEDGKITTYLQLERWTRRKYDNQLHLHIEELFDQGIVPLPKEADLVFVNSFVGNSFLSQSGRVRFDAGPRSQLSTTPVPGKAWLETRQWGGREYTAYSLDHELAHICANLPFYGPFKENSLLVHFDGGASLGNFSAWLYRNGKLEVLECHWKLAHLSKLFNDNALSFAMLNHLTGEHCAVPGKLMGFATMAEPDPKLSAWLARNGWFKGIWEDPSHFYAAAKQDFNWTGRLGDTRDVFLQKLAACFQWEFESKWMAYLATLQENVKADFLYLSGGCTLNIVANTKIVNSGLFNQVFAPPCPGDSGLSIGAAAFVEWRKHGKMAAHSPYLNNAGLDFMPDYLDDRIVRKVARAISDGMVIGVCNGPGEAGPRALGNRSILARADSLEIAQKVSMGCKKREWYRPIAPVMLERHAKRLTGLPSIDPLSRHMLLDFHIPEEHRAEIKGVVHSNGTSRIQTLFHRSENPFLWDLLNVLDEMRGIPALINTSFNSRGEPIVHTPEQAMESGIAMGLDGVVVNHELRMIKERSLG